MDKHFTVFLRRVSKPNKTRVPCIPSLHFDLLSLTSFLVFAGVNASKRTGSDTTHGSLVVGFDPIGDLVAELRRRFGHLAVFFSPGAAGASGIVGLVWRPSAFVPRPYNVNRSRHMMVVGDGQGGGEGQGKGRGGGALMTTNVLEVLAEMKALGGDMFEGVNLS